MTAETLSSLGFLSGNKALYERHFKDLVMVDRAMAEIALFPEQLAMV